MDEQKEYVATEKSLSLRTFANHHYYQQQDHISICDLFCETIMILFQEEVQMTLVVVSKGLSRLVPSSRYYSYLSVASNFSLNLAYGIFLASFVIRSTLPNSKSEFICFEFVQKS